MRMQRRDKAYWVKDMKERHRREREARARGEEWDGQMPGSQQLQPEQLESLSQAGEGEDQAGPINAAITGPAAGPSTAEPVTDELSTSSANLHLNDSERPSWDNASELSLKAIEDMIKEPSYQGPHLQTPTSMPRGRWVVQSREIKDPANCANTYCLFRMAKIRNMRKLVENIIGAPPPVLEYHGYADPTPGTTTLAWVSNTYRRLYYEHILDYRRMLPWNNVIARMQTFRGAMEVEGRFEGWKEDEFQHRCLGSLRAKPALDFISGKRLHC